MPELSRRPSNRRVGALVLALVAVLLALPAGSQAAFPGASGKLAFGNNSSGSFDIFSVSSTGGLAATPLTSSSALENEPAWSPDGSKIAFSVVGATFGNIYVMNADGSGAKNLTDKLDSYNTKPAWSPDGSQLAFYSNRDGDNEIYSMKADGTGQTNLTHDSATEDYWPAWSPNGKQIAFTRLSGNDQDVWVMNSDGSAKSNLTQLGAAGNSEPSWSPDGSRIAFRSGRDGNAEIYVMNTDGSGPVNRTNDPGLDVSAAWSPDGSKIAFTSDRPGNEEIYLMPAGGGAATRFTADPARDGYPDWQPLAPSSATITVRNAERPSSAGGRFDLSVGSTVVRTAADHGDAGSASVSPGVHRVSETASGGTSLTQYATSISCTNNGDPDVSGSGTSIDLAVKYGDVEECTVTNTLGAQTSAGSNVVVTPPDVTDGSTPVTITFLSVSADGVTTLSSSPSGPPAPAGFEIAGSYYHLETTASFSSAEVCFPYTGAPPSTVLHWVNGSPVMEPVVRDTGSEVCAEVTSFSPFALARFVGGDDTDAPHIACGSADGDWHAHNVSIDCSAEDAGAGLADPADAAFSLSTSVPAGSEDASGSTGSHQVCDNAGNCATAGPIGGNKIDRKAPALSLPADKTVDATSPAGAPVSFTATTSDGADPHPSVSCAPASGSTFKIGSSTVACTATDHVGNTDHGSLTVTVRGAKEQLDRLVQDVIAASKLPPALKTQLATKLRSLVAAFDPSKPAQRTAVCNALAEFITAVRALSGHGIPAAQATQWIADANRIRAVIPCGTAAR